MFVIKKEDKMLNKTFRLPEGLAERLERIAKEEHISMNNLVVQCCEYALGEMRTEASPKE